MEPIAVVIPSWNCRELLHACIESVLPELDAGSELLVVDNGSRDGTAEMLRDRAIPHVALAENVGFAAAVNLGARRTGQPFVFVLNADTELLPGAPAKLAAALGGGANLGGVQPRIVQHDPNPVHLYSTGQILRKDGRGLERDAGALDRPAPEAVEEVFGVCGAACVLRRELFTRLGGYDERFFAFHEDVDLNARARLAGWSFGYVAAAVVRHHGAGAWAKGPSPARFNTRLMARNRLATDIKVMPARYLPRILAAEAGALAKSVPRGLLPAALGGRMAALRSLPSLLAERRRLRRDGNPALLRQWLS